MKGFNGKQKQVLTISKPSQLTYSNSTIETLEKGVKYVQS